MWTRYLARRTQHAILAAAAVLALWFGVTAPSLSPVAPDPAVTVPAVEVGTPGLAPAAVTTDVDRGQLRGRGARR